MRDPIRVLASVLSSGLVACAPFGPQSSIQSESATDLAAADRIPVYAVGDRHPAAGPSLGPVKAHSCQYWSWSDPATSDDALRRLKLAALKMGANAVIDGSLDAQATDYWAHRCWESILATGTAVQLEVPSVADAVMPPDRPAGFAPEPAVAGTPPVFPVATMTIAGTDRREFLAWLMRLHLTRTQFALTSPAGEPMDLLADDSTILKWSIQAPEPSAASVTTEVLLVPDVTTVSISVIQGPDQVEAAWTANAKGGWDSSYVHFKKTASAAP